MRYIWMKGNFWKSKIKSRKYNKMVMECGWRRWRWRCNGAMMGMMPKPPIIRVVTMICAFLVVPPPLRVLVSRNVGSPIYLNGMKVFDKAVRLTYGTARRYGRAVVVPLVAKASVNWFCGWLPPRCEINCNYDFNGLQWTYFYPKVRIPLIVSINTFRSVILLKINTKGARECDKILKS
jgi:hypothetical protein